MWQDGGREGGRERRRELAQKLMMNARGTTRKPSEYPVNLNIYLFSSSLRLMSSLSTISLIHDD